MSVLKLWQRLIGSPAAPTNASASPAPPANPVPELADLPPAPIVSRAPERPLPARPNRTDASPAAASAPPVRARSEEWVPVGAAAVVAGRPVPGGMVYVGSNLDSVAQRGVPDPALIRPELAIDWSQPDLAGAGMGYWPSYSEISPQSRAAYLHWLKGGRDAPGTYIGYVFLFFYGLERRVLHDLAAADVAHPELTAIGAELRRLLSLYGENGSFHGYATGLLSYLEAPRVDDKLYAQAPPVDLQDTDLPFRFRVGLGQAARDGASLPWTWALAWYRMTARSRAPIERCPDELHELFRLRYAEQHGSGLVLRDARSRLRIEYHPASAGFHGQTFERDVGVPDVATLSAPVQRLSEIGDRCCDDLAPYARLLARDPEAAGSLAGIALLPAGLDGLAAGDAGVQFEALVSRVRAGAGKPLLVAADELIQLWPSDAPTGLTKSEGVLLSQLLARHGVGVEPDVRFGGRPLRSGTRAALFMLPDERADSPTPGFHAGTLLLTLTTAVAASDNEVSDAEERLLASHFEEGLHLGVAERARLRAYLDLLLAEPPKLTGLTRKLKELEQPQRQAIGRFLVRVAAADGRVDVSEMKVLARAFRLLSLDPGSVHSEIHALSTGVPASEPVTMQTARPVPGHAIPKPPAPAKPRTVVLNAAAIDAKQLETVRVSALLEEVLGDDDAPEEVPTMAAPTGRSSEPAAPSALGLDAAHGRLLLKLMEREQWPWDELRAVAAGLGLMADGALERINQVALERLDAPACESGDPTWIDLNVLKELLS